MSAVKTKFLVSKIEGTHSSQLMEGELVPSERRTIEMVVVQDGSDENVEFFQKYPAGKISLDVMTAKDGDLFESGQEVDVTFSPGARRTNAEKSKDHRPAAAAKEAKESAAQALKQRERETPIDQKGSRPLSTLPVGPRGAAAPFDSAATNPRPEHVPGTVPNPTLANTAVTGRQQADAKAEHVAKSTDKPSHTKH